MALSADNSKNIVLIYPNPVGDNGSLTITMSRPGKVQGRIIDLSGRLVKEYQWQLTAGSTALSLELNKLAKGMYYLELKGETINERKQFVKQ